MQRIGVSKQTRNNWLIDAGLALSAMLAMISGIYFLFLPVGGYQGGRNLTYGIIILFERHTWDDIHTWGGAAMIAVAAVHLAIHWGWVTGMAKRTWRELSGQCGNMNARGRYNLVLNLVVGISFILTAISGIYFLFSPGGPGAADTAWLFSRFTWDMIHTWAGITLILAAVLHFAIHWMWVVKVTRSIFHRVSQPLQRPVNQTAAGAAQES